MELSCNSSSVLRNTIRARMDLPSRPGRPDESIHRAHQRLCKTKCEFAGPMAFAKAPRLLGAACCVRRSVRHQTGYPGNKEDLVCRSFARRSGDHEPSKNFGANPEPHHRTGRDVLFYEGLAEASAAY